MRALFRTGLHTFLTMNGLLSGEIHVHEGLPRRKGARGWRRKKETKSRTSPAGPGDGSGNTDGGSAMTSTARSSARGTNAGPADGQGEEPTRAPIPGGTGPGDGGPGLAKGSLVAEIFKELPGTKWGLSKAVNLETQIVPVIGGLLKSNDEKVRLRMVELLIETAYAEDAGNEEEKPSGGAGWSIPRPERD